MTIMPPPTRLAEAIAWRHHLHRHPEMAFRETATAAFVASRLAQWGYIVTTGIAGTGVVASLSKGSGRKSIGIRADMDALPIEECTGLPYRSVVPGVMHACGHDGHVAILLATAREAAEMAFDGTLHLIFQPAEENEGGAREMVEAGLFRRFPVDAIYGLHNWPDLPIGTVVARDREMMAALGLFEIRLQGQGSHAAMPQDSADVLVASAAIIGALQTIVSRNLDPTTSAVVSVTQIHAGETWNVLPESAVLRGTTRWFSDRDERLIISRLQALANAVADGFQCQAIVEHQSKYPATINTSLEAGQVRSAAVKRGYTVLDTSPSMAAEDFAFMLRERPGCYFWIGAKRPEAANPGLHSPNFDFNDEAIPVGVRLFLDLIHDEIGTR